MHTAYSPTAFAKEATMGDPQVWTGLHSWDCIMGNVHMGPLVDRLTDRHTYLKAFPSGNFVGGR